LDQPEVNLTEKLERLRKSAAHKVEIAKKQENTVKEMLFFLKLIHLHNI